MLAVFTVEGLFHTSSIVIFRRRDAGNAAIVLQFIADVIFYRFYYHSVVEQVMLLLLTLQHEDQLKIEQLLMLSVASAQVTHAMVRNFVA